MAIAQDEVLGTWQDQESRKGRLVSPRISSRPSRDWCASFLLSQDFVLGYCQSPLRGFL